jgi:Holliday junction resolvasome RuvABC endonuclease subunit
MRILALDFGTKTGWATHNGGFGVPSGTEEFPIKRGESPGMRYLRFSRWVGGQLNLYQVSLVVYEQAHHRGGYATALLEKMIGIMEMNCAALMIEYTPVHSATLKKWATGNGRADKEDMVLAAVQRFPDVAIKDDNQADALLLLAYAEEKFGNHAAITTSQTESMEG